MKCMVLHHPVTSMHQKFQEDIPKDCLSEFPVPSVLKRALFGLVVFIGVEHVYTYKRQEFQNIIERKLYNCFGQLILIH